MQTKAKNSITIIRRFSKPPKFVWRAWTEPESVKLWFGSDPKGKVLRAHLDVRVTGTFEVSFVNSDMQAFTCYGSYQEVDPYRTLTFTWGWKEQPDVMELVTVQLEAAGSGTEMVLIHGDIDPHTVHSYGAGWNSTFDKLEKVLGSKQSTA